MVTGALSHLKVLDLSRVLAGPWAGQILGDLGADVIKIERPGHGDETRTWGPPYVKDAAGEPTGESAYYLGANRNKRSVAIDIAQPEGQQLVRDLVAKVDILLENYKVGDLARYGLDYASLHALNPRLVYCSITGFGQTGPYAQRAGYDFLIQAMGGLMSVTGRADGQPGAGPLKAGVALTDILTGLYASTSILAAIAHRDVTGIGQHIDLALLDVQVACMANQAMNHLVAGTVAGRLGNAHPNIVPYQDFPASDGDLIIAVGNDRQFRRLCEALGHAAWADDARYRSNPDRVAHRDALVAAIAAVTALEPMAHWVARLEAVQVPCGPVNNMAQVFADTQVQARGLKQQAPHALAGEAPFVASPIRLSETPVQYRRAAPVLGEHTQDVLRELLGLDAEQLNTYAAQGVIGVRNA